jgi:hypothetical protein
MKYKCNECGEVVKERILADEHLTPCPNEDCPGCLEKVEIEPVMMTCKGCGKEINYNEMNILEQMEFDEEGLCCECKRILEDPDFGKYIGQAKRIFNESMKVVTWTDKIGSSENSLFKEDVKLAKLIIKKKEVDQQIKDHIASVLEEDRKDAE